MSIITVADAKAFLRVMHDLDDALIQGLLDSAESEACRFMNRTDLPTLPLSYPNIEYDSNGDPTEVSSEISPSSEEQVVPDVRYAVMRLVQADYEGSKPEERALYREAAETMLMPYRGGLGV